MSSGRSRKVLNADLKSNLKISQGQFSNQPELVQLSADFSKISCTAHFST